MRHIAERRTVLVVGARPARRNAAARRGAVPGAEHRIEVPAGGTVTGLLVHIGGRVDAGQPLLVVA
ncbi:hypothetical protein ACFVDQ_24840 [Streptomyces sp. NPDC057684]|uniref:hypothetical protein n=1 Tax=unclassified Streptomyces TaxID=2593676 RepID=UPI00369CD580